MYLRNVLSSSLPDANTYLFTSLEKYIYHERAEEEEKNNRRPCALKKKQKENRKDLTFFLDSY